MWVITHIYTGCKFYFLPEVKKYVVGRLGSDIALLDDTSISRSHAVFHNTNLSLKLEDAGSKYGTYCNEDIGSKTKLPKGLPLELKEGDHVLFGALKNEWLISKNYLITTVSSVCGTQLNEIKELLNLLGGKIKTDWDSSCTHLTMTELTITIKVLHALIEQIPIVSCEFWKHYLKNLRSKKPPPKESLFLPKRNASLSSAINVKNFEFNDQRKTLFCGKTFVFMSKRHYDMYSPIVIKAGGECRDLKSKVSKSFLLRKDVVVIQYVASTQSQGSQTINSISEYLELHSFRTIPEYEIGLAIVCCTIQKYCNPSHNTIEHFLHYSPDRSPKIGTILAENTRPETSRFNTVELSAVEIPDSEIVNNGASQSKAFESEIYEESIQCGAKATSTHNLKSSEELRNEDKRDVEESEERVDTLPSQKLYSPTNKEKKVTVTYTLGINEKRKRKPSIENELQIVKKAHICPQIDLNISESSNEEFNITKELSVAASATNNDSHSQPINNQSPLLAMHCIRHKTNMATGFSGFLRKSQIVRKLDTGADDRVQQPISESRKRGRLARITDDEDDLFNFGSSPKKSKSLNHNLDEELFTFKKSKPTENINKSGNFNEVEVLPKTQLFVPRKSVCSKVNAINIKVSPMNISKDGWLSKLSVLNIKSDNDVKMEQTNEDGDCNRTEWINLLKGFKVRTRKINISSRENSTVHNVSNSTLSHSKTNFKMFIKKCNYKPQTLIIPTVPKVVPPMY